MCRQQDQILEDIPTLDDFLEQEAPEVIQAQASTTCWSTRQWGPNCCIYNDNFTLIWDEEYYFASLVIENVNFNSIQNMLEF